MLVLRRYGVLFAGLLLLLVGGIVLVAGVGRYLALQDSAGFGWTAYAPLESTAVYLPQPMAQIVSAVVLMVLGLVTAAVWFVLWLRRADA